jgi:hypothetical protein
MDHIVILKSSGKPVVVCILSISAKAFAVKISKSGLNSIKENPKLPSLRLIVAEALICLQTNI